MRVILSAAAGTGFAFVMTALGAAAVFLFRGEPNPCANRGMMGFAGGVMTAASVWSLLLPAIAQTDIDGIFPGWFPALCGILAGAVFLSVLDALFLRAKLSRRQNALLLTAITLHNIPEGMAVGLACALAAREPHLIPEAAALAFGIGIQNFPEGAAVSLPLCQDGFGTVRAFRDGVLSGIVEPLSGILAALAVSFAQPLMPWLMSFAAGAMVYVTVDDLIPQAHGRIGTWAFLTGFALMMTLDTAFG